MSDPIRKSANWVRELEEAADGDVDAPEACVFGRIDAVIVMR